MDDVLVCAKCDHKDESHKPIYTIRGIMLDCKVRGCECRVKVNEYRVKTKPSPR